MTQSTILLTTLSVMLGLGVGYWFGWLTNLVMQVITPIIATAACISIMADSIRDMPMTIYEAEHG